MFRSFRWQFIALIIAVALFTASAIHRISRQTDHSVSVSSTPFIFAAASTPTKAPANTRDPITANDDPLEAEARSERSLPLYREGMFGSVQRLNPLLAHLNPNDNDISSLIFEGLFVTNEYGEVVPRLATELVISGDGLEYVVILREDVKWQDGINFDADDVVFTMSLLSDPEYTKFSPAGEFWQTVETQKLSDHLLRFRLAQPLGSFPRLLTIGMLPEHALRGTTVSKLVQHPFNLTPIGTGPYQLDSLQVSEGNVIDAVELALSPVFQERPQARDGYTLSRLRFQFYPDVDAALQAYASGEVNALANIAPRESLLSLPQSQILTQVNSSLFVLIFNWRDRPFSDRKIRQALSLSLDVPSLTERQLGSSATYADSPYTPGSSVYSPNTNWTSYDLVQATTLLEAAGILEKEDESDDSSEDESTPVPASESRFSLLVEDSTALIDLAREIAAQWTSIGLEFEIEAIDVSELTNRLETGRFDSAIVTQRIGADPDLFRFWHPAQIGKGQNFGAASNDEIAELLEKARREIYSTRRADFYRQLQEAFAEQVIAIPLYYPLYTYVLRDTIEGVQLGYVATPADRFRGIREWRPVTLTG